MDESIGLQPFVHSTNLKLEEFLEILSTNAETIRSAILDSFEYSELDIVINSVPTMISFGLSQLMGSHQKNCVHFPNYILEKNIMMSTTIYPSIQHSRRYVRGSREN